MARRTVPIGCRSGVVLALLLGIAPLAAAGSPSLARILPRGGRRGSEIEISLSGARLADAVDLVFESGGIALLELVPERDDLARARIAIAPDAPIGWYGVRVRTRSGLSELKTFAVGAFPELAEVEDNGARERAQPIALDVTVHGVAQYEDADWYVFEGRAGECVSAEVQGLRLGGELFDPHLALLDERGFELARCDDGALGRQDPILAVLLPADGRYFLRVRESAYRGGPNAHYLLSVGRFARPLLTYPLGGRAGERVSLELLGDPRGVATQEVALPGEARGSPLGWMPRGCIAWTPDGANGSVPSPLFLHLSSYAGVLEIEPNDALGEAVRFTAPAALDGRIDAPADRDLWVFAAKAGERYEIAVHARASRSPLDARIQVLDAAGNVHAGNDDDGARPDSRLRFQVPADGDWLVAVDDHLGAGSPLHVYRIEVAQPRPALRLEATRERQGAAVPAGGRAALLLQVERIDFDGPLVLEVGGLPPGVSALVPPCPEGIASLPLVLEAAGDAPLAHALASLTIRHADPAAGITQGFRQDVELTYGQNLTLFCAQTMERVPVAVTESAPFALELEPHAAPLVQDGSTRLGVQILRREGFVGPVTLHVPFLPPGVSAQQGLVADPATQRVEIPVDANGGALPGKFSLCVTGSGDAGGGPIEYASALVELEVAPPFVRFRGEATSVERGGAASLAITVEKLPGFTGAAQVELLGLPNATTAASVSLDAQSATILFTIATTPESPLGRHQGLWCLARFTTERGAVVHRLGAAELRIDEPVATAAAAPPPPPPPPPSEGAPQVIETRLQKLRRETEERRAQRAESGDAERASDEEGGG